jgi:hypothetical protein
MTGQDPTSMLSATECDDGAYCLTEMSVEEVAEAERYPNDDAATDSNPHAGEAAAIQAPRRRRVSGRYRAQNGAVHLELRVDVDGVRPQRKVSGDFFRTSGSSTTHIGSFIVDAPTLTTTPASVRIRGSGSFSFPATAPFVEVTIARVTPLQPPGFAVIRFSNAPGGSGPQYHASFESKFFRTFRLETDRTSDVQPPAFQSYDTGFLASGGPQRTLTVVKAFSEAGIEIIPIGPGRLVDIASAGPNATWSDAELHAAMLDHFSLLQNSSQQAAWLLEALEHENHWLGIMFDKIGLQRQGCAVFYRSIGGASSDMQRLQLYTYVHELGHCFNILHSWEKSFANPPGINRPDALSWMMYPWKYPLGMDVFWARFPFQFDSGELVHLRHGFRDHVLMGGSPLAAGAALIGPEVMREPATTESGLALEIEGVHPSFWLGEPVVVKLALRSATQTTRRVLANIHPNASVTTVVIEQPTGRVIAYKPMFSHLYVGTTQEVGSSNPIECSAYIGYGENGHYFDRPGTYKVRAIYHALDGSNVFSDVATFRVSSPASPIDERMAELMLGEQQGQLLYLKGSDSHHLSIGNDAFRQILDKYPQHAMADYMCFIHGINAARAFKSLDPAHPGRIYARPRNLTLAKDLIGRATRPESRLDELSKEEVLKWLHEIIRKNDEPGRTGDRS